LTAAVVSRENDSERIIVPDHTIVAIGTTTRDEAHFVCALMNSSVAGFIVRGYVALHPSPHVMKYISIPRYNARDSLHRKLVVTSISAHDAVANQQSEQAAECDELVDQLAGQLWQINERELADIQKSLRDLVE